MKRLQERKDERSEIDKDERIVTVKFRELRDFVDNFDFLFYRVSFMEDAAYILTELNDNSLEGYRFIFQDVVAQFKALQKQLEEIWKKK
ncbi:MAG: hypothetical protein IBX72_06880 [Nitrospirae bacterium]|nr:hypothetical protein [Nitrospirota bacterium]